jgi:predicted transcriptional regulator of viral defense system
VVKIANQLYFPSYLSFESALSRYGILSQIPYTQTFATNKKSKKMILWSTEVEFRQIKTDLFFGYELVDEIYLARPEKALLDQLYMVSRGLASLNLKELDLKNINASIFAQFSREYPQYLQAKIRKIKKLVS